MTYYERTESVNSDGSPLFAIDYDKRQETEIQTLVEREWKCQIHAFGRLCPLDYYAERDGRLVGIIEMKRRSHSSEKFSTVFLNVRKWIALTMAQIGLGVPAVFIAGFDDGPRYISVSEVDASKVRIGGTVRRVKSHTDIEPVIEVPVADMKPIMASSTIGGASDSDSEG